MAALHSPRGSRRSRAPKQSIQRAILGTLAVGGILSAPVLARNALQLLRYKERPRTYSSRFYRALRALAARGYLVVDAQNSTYMTNKGTKYLNSLSNEPVSFKKPAVWDGKWRIVIFDIPEKKRKYRDQLRSLIERLGFYKLQDSVWVYPYECESALDQIRADYPIELFIRYIVAESIERDKVLRRQFELPMK